VVQEATHAVQEALLPAAGGGDLLCAQREVFKDNKDLAKDGDAGALVVA